MLYLSRKVGESILIDGNIEIIVTLINNKQVKLGIEAPRNSSVYRKELLEKIKQGNRDAIDSANWLIEDSENVEDEFLSDSAKINTCVSDALGVIYGFNMPNILEVTAKMSDFLKKYSDPEELRSNRDKKLVLDAVCSNYKKLLSEVEKRNKVIEKEVALVADYIYNLGEAA